MKLSPELQRRIDALDGCQGRWIVDCRALEGNYSYALRSLSEPWPFIVTDPLGAQVERYWHCSTQVGAADYPHKLGSLLDAATYCAHTGWEAKLLFSSRYLDADCSWPGGYDAPSIYRSNNRVFADNHSKALAAGADGDGPGLSLDVRYVNDDMIEELHGLESYPLLSEDDHSELELELQDEAWDSWAARDWAAAVEKLLALHASETADQYWAADTMETVAAEKLHELFHACCESSNTYWQEEQGDQWIDLDRVAADLDLADLRELTGLPLLAADQQWRREAYPWPDGSTDPLEPALA